MRSQARQPALALALSLLSTSALPAQEAASLPAADAVTVASAPLAATVSSLLQAPAAQRAHWGIAVVRLDGRPVFSLHQEQLFRPASTAKLFTTAAAMSLLGPAARASSSISFPMPTADGAVAGDVVLQGGEDADFSGQERPWAAPGAPASSLPAPSPLHGVEEFAAEVAARGVLYISGDVVAPVTWDPYPQGWAAEDMLWGYGAPVSSVSLQDNQIELRVTGGSVPGAAAAVLLTPETGFYRVAGSVTTAAGAQSEVTVHHDPGDGTLRLQGSIGVGTMYKTEIAVDDPALFTARALRQAFVAHGIAVDGTARAPRTELPDTNFVRGARQPLTLPVSPQAETPPATEVGTVVLTHHAPTLAEDTVSTLKESLNLHAELLLRRLGSLAGDRSTNGGARVVHQWLLNTGIPEHEFVFFDGSGLSTKDLVTPQAEAALLVYASRQPWFAPWKAALPVGGVDGTLASRFTTAPLKSHVFAKTGTLGETRALAGYLRCASGTELAFSIMVDNHEPGTPLERAVMDSVVAAIAAAN